MDWFEKIFGFKESANAIKDNIVINDEKLSSLYNNTEYNMGKLEVISIFDLRKKLPEPSWVMNVSSVIGDIGSIHEENPNATIQVASQFNLLEMMSPKNNPEQGITKYIYDRTQGPICAMKCAAGTLYRNYFTKIDTLEKTRKVLGYHYWDMINGYALFQKKDLLKLNKLLDLNYELQEKIIESLEVGIQWDTEVIGSNHNVTQVYCSAIPVSYHHEIHSSEFAPFAKLILEATYEAAFIAAVLNEKSNKLFLTFVGGGAFGNDMDWILSAIEKNLKKFEDFELDVVLVSYGTIPQKVKELTEKY